MLIVFGSINMDMVVEPEHLPQAGETVLCDDYDLFPGGKGANQALAAARMGARTALVGCVGGDHYSQQILATIRRQGVMTSGVAESERPTGCAMIMREKGGQNRIIVAGGANNEAKADQIPDEILREGAMVLTQGEVPAAEICTLIRRAHERGVKVILNLAPAFPLPEDVLRMVWILVVNEIEIGQVTASLGLPVTAPEEMAKALATKGKTTCIVTRAEKGSVVVQPDGKTFAVSALPIDEVVDTTGAGDAYCGTLSACLYSGMNLEESVRWAAVAGSLACTKEGTINAFAYQDDIRENLERVSLTR
ncbi:MAG: ribokinase [Micavibrio sp.]